jgi:hypothetical protein
MRLDLPTRDELCLKYKMAVHDFSLQTKFSPIICKSNLVVARPNHVASRITGAEIQARRMLPINVRGTALGNVK